MKFFKWGKKRTTDVDTAEPSESVDSNGDADVSERGYQTFGEALKTEIDTGSLDVKEMTVELESRTITVQVSGNVVKNIIDPHNVLILSVRSFWDSALSREEKIQIRAHTSTDDSQRYSEVSALLPDLLPQIRQYYHDYALQNLVEASEEFSPGTDVHTSVVMSPSRAREIDTQDFLDLPLSDVDTTLRTLLNKERMFGYYLGLDEVSAADARVTVVDNAPQHMDEKNDDTVRFALDAAHRGVSVSDARTISGGFIWGDILESLNNLSDDAVISVQPADHDENIDSNVESPAFTVSEDALRRAITAANEALGSASTTGRVTTDEQHTESSARTPIPEPLPTLFVEPPQPSSYASSTVSTESDVAVSEYVDSTDSSADAGGATDDNTTDVAETETAPELLEPAADLDISDESMSPLFSDMVESLGFDPLDSHDSGTTSHPL